MTALPRRTRTRLLPTKNLFPATSFFGENPASWRFDVCDRSLQLRNSLTNKKRTKLYELHLKPQGIDNSRLHVMALVAKTLFSLLNKINQYHPVNNTC